MRLNPIKTFKAAEVDLLPAGHLGCTDAMKHACIVTSEEGQQVSMVMY